MIILYYFVVDSLSVCLYEFDEPFLRSFQEIYIA